LDDGGSDGSYDVESNNGDSKRNWKMDHVVHKRFCSEDKIKYCKGCKIVKDVNKGIVVY
jgi:hypothetical protein